MKVVESFIKHQRMIVLGAALAIIVLYILPLDQLAALAQSQWLKTKLAFEKAISKVKSAKGKAKLIRAEYRVLFTPSRGFLKACAKGVIQLCPP